ncbi:hypothetical protein [Nocardia sp. N2S4-5]|uniref:hypothetical protein n=1 Tax=Nocardia sp. N2S4-5 TaxID=3351565 RepID=UPI0037D236C9
MTSFPFHFQVRQLIARATSAGYCLVRAPSPPHNWTLLDAEDGELVFSSPYLDQIRQWLDT